MAQDCCERSATGGASGQWRDRTKIWPSAEFMITGAIVAREFKALVAVSQQERALKFDFAILKTSLS